MADVWGFRDKETADRVIALVKPPQEIYAGRTQRTRQPRIMGGGSILALTPPGGIPAMTGSGPFTWGSATCTLVSEDGIVGAETQVVKNIVNQAIAGSVVIKANRVGSIFIVDVASCGS